MGISEPQPPATALDRDALLADKNLVDTAMSGGLMTLDRSGRILDCSQAVMPMFGLSHGQFIGKRVTEFIPGLFRDGSSPSFDTRYLVYLCTDGEWRRFEAVDANGQSFSVSLSLSRTDGKGHEFFFLNVRRCR